MRKKFAILFAFNVLLLWGHLQGLGIADIKFQAINDFDGNVTVQFKTNDAAQLNADQESLTFSPESGSTQKILSLLDINSIKNISIKIKAENGKVVLTRIKVYTPFVLYRIKAGDFSDYIINNKEITIDDNKALVLGEDSEVMFGDFQNKGRLNWITFFIEIALLLFVFSRIVVRYMFLLPRCFFIFKNLNNLFIDISRLIEKEFTAVLLFYSKKGYVIYLLFVVLFVCYGFTTFNWSISIDTEIAMNRPFLDMAAVLIRNGRFGLIPLFLFTRHAHLVPYISNLMTTLFLGASALLWYYLLSLPLQQKHKNTYSLKDIIIPAFFVSYPCLASTFLFTYHNFETLIGMLLCLSSVLFTYKFALLRDISYFYLSTAFLLSSMSCSQIYFLIYFVATCCLFFIEFYQHPETSFNIIFKKIMYVFCSASSFFFLLWFFLIKSNILPSSHNYIHRYIRWGKEDFSKIVNNAIHYAYRLLFEEMVFNGRFLLFSYAIILFTIFLVFYTRHKKAFWCNILLLGILLAPFSSFIVLGSGFPVWDLYYLPFILTFGLFLLSNAIGRFQPLLKFVFYIFLLWGITWQSWGVSYLMQGEYIKSQNDTFLARELYERINAYQIQEQNYKLPVAILGFKRSVLPPDSGIKTGAIGYSFFEWGKTATIRPRIFMNLLGYNFVAANPQQLEFAKSFKNIMPSWPAEGSILLKNGVLIVKLGDN